MVITKNEANKKAEELLKNFKNNKKSKSKSEDLEVLGSIEFTVSENDIRGYDEKSCTFYILHPKSESHKFITISYLPIKFCGLAIDDNENRYFDAIINGKAGNYTLSEFIDELKSYGVTGPHREKIIEFLLLYMNGQNILKNARPIHPDNIYIDKSGIIRVEEAKSGNLQKILETIFKLYKISTSPDNFAINLAYFLIAPLSFYFRKAGELFPYLINSGFAQSGKTTFQLLFGNLGYAQDPVITHFTRNDLKTFYTLMRSRSESILPITLEDVELSWIKFQAQMLKGSAGTVNGGSRGYLHKVIKYLSKSQLAFDTNDMVDTQIAQLDRFIICTFSASDKNRVNIANFEAIKEELHPGFMFSIFDALFSGKELKSVMNEIYNVKNRDALKINIIKYMIEKLNSIMPKNMKFRMPDFSLNNETNAIDWAGEVYNIGIDIYEQLSSEGKAFNIYELRMSQIDFGEGTLYLTASGFSLLQKHLALPWKSIHELNNNNNSREFLTKLSTHRFGKNKDSTPQRCLIITKNDGKDLVDPELQKLLNAKKTLEDLKVSTTDIDNKIKEWKAHNTKTENAEEITSDNDINSTPEGPVKRSLIEERKLNETKKANNINSKTITIPENYKIYYYQMTRNFNKYDFSFFQGSGILFDSSMTITKKGSSETAYVLLKLRIPDTLNKTPKDWNEFLTDSRELKSENEYNALSRGDSS